MKQVVRKVEAAGNRNVLLCERGVSFGYNTLVSDMRSLPIMAETGCPVVFDATHSVQQPGGQGDARAAASANSCRCWRARPWPSASPWSSWRPIRIPTTRRRDGPNMVRLKDMPALLARLQAFDRLAKENMGA